MSRLIYSCLACILALPGCRDLPEARHPDSPRAVRSAADTVQVVQPLVLAFFATSRVEIDQNPEVEEALADFQSSLPRMQRELALRGAHLYESYKDTIVVIREGESEILLPRNHASSVGYVFYAPAQRPQIFYGVMTDADLLEQARIYFGW